jgi:hypothetical protein
VNKPQNLPELDRISVLSALILLAYALARFIDLPTQVFGLQLPGIYLEVKIDVQTLVALLVAGMTASGADWLFQDHPSLDSKKPLEHLLLPALTALVIGLPLFQLPLGPIWWAGFAIGGILIMLVLVAEYITIDPDDARNPVAAAGLTAVAFALFLTLAISMRYEAIRLFIMLPVLTLAADLVSLRAMHLRLQGQWMFMPAVVVALIGGQITAAVHYWPLSPVVFGLVLLGPIYGLTSLLAALAEGETITQAIIEPATVIVIVWGVAIWIG